MESATKKIKGYPTNPQKMRLIQLLEADDKLRGCKFSATFTKKVAEARWAAVALELNSIQGAKKDWPEWRRLYLLFMLGFLILICVICVVFLVCYHRNHPEINSCEIKETTPMRRTNANDF